MAFTKMGHHEITVTSDRPRIVTVSCNANFKIQTLLIVKKQRQVMVRLVKAVQKMSAKVAVINLLAV